ncbi:MAG: nuclear transport factor 2 family protein [Saprospiraceae bacterium]|nr:nuclear transport factor 2 family protein [Saprospiraceae bacterium]
MKDPYIVRDMSVHCIKSFYNAFEARDAEGMASCYHADVVFTDPAFGDLEGSRASDMWRMLCNNIEGKFFEFHCDQVQGDENKGSAYWEAKYDFSKTGRRVHNKIHATFEFKEGKIIRHIDRFDLHRWAGMALGWKGRLIGGTGFFRRKLQQQTNGLLDRYLQERQAASQPNK